VSEYGIDGARRMAAESHRSARDALDRAAGPRGAELHQITDFIYTRSS
jgi:geranylgeranyl diphosphate synthase type II